MLLPEMEDHATEGQISSLVARLDREGAYLTQRALFRIHAILNDCKPDMRAEGNQKQLGELINERIERDGREG